MHVKVSTTDTIPSESIVEYKGIIFDRVVAGVGLFTEWFAGLTDMFGGRSGKMEAQMDSLYNNLIQSMVDKASRVGANAIVGLRIDIDEISGKGMSMLMISGTGTAVCTKSAGATTAQDKVGLQKSAMWICVNCGMENVQFNGFCTSCGAKRSWPWKCSDCETTNGEMIRFCPKCGKRKDQSEEIIPEVPNYAGDIDRMREAIRGMNSASEMLKFFEDAFKDDINPDVAHFLAALRKKVEFERLYGSAIRDAEKIAASFLDGGMKYARVDRSADEITCPVCGTKQRSNRIMCHHCSSTFVDADT